MLEKPMARISLVLMPIGFVGLIWIWTSQLFSLGDLDVLTRYYIAGPGILGVVPFYLSRKLQMSAEHQSQVEAIGKRSPSGRSFWVSQDLFVSFRRGSLGIRQTFTDWVFEVNGRWIRSYEPGNKADIEFTHDGAQYNVHWVSTWMDSTPEITVSKK